MTEYCIIPENLSNDIASIDGNATASRNFVNKSSIYLLSSVTTGMVPCNILKQVPKLLVLGMAVVDSYGDDGLVSFVSIKCMNKPTFVYQQTSYTSNTKT